MKNQSTFQINLIRLVFLLVSILAGMAVAASTIATPIEIPIWLGLLIGTLLAWMVICFEHFSRKFTLRGFSRATFGLMIGIFSAWLLNRVPIQELLVSITDNEFSTASLEMAYGLVTYLVMGFLGVVLALRSGQENFAFVIPYVRFRQSSANEQLLILDETAILDTRLDLLISTNVIEGRIMVPQFVFSEISLLSTSSDKVKKEKGEKALQLLDDLRSRAGVRIVIGSRDESDASETTQERIVRAAQANNAKIVTADDNLAKLARLQSLTVLNIEEVASAFQPKVAVGEKLRLTISRTGKEGHQGVGYLPDGSMIVVNHAVKLIGTSQEVVVISKIQSGTGFLIFAELDNKKDA